MTRGTNRNSYHTWSDDQDAWLRANALTYPVPVLIDMMRHEFDITRTYDSISKRKVDLGIIDADHTWLSSRQVAKVLGVAPSWVWLIRRKRLITTYPANRMSRHDVAILPSDLEEFVRREHLRFTPEGMPRGRYRSIVEMEYRTNRYMTVSQVARTLHIGNWTDCVRNLYATGIIPARLVACSGHNGGPRWVAKLADVLTYIARRDGVAV